MIWFLSQRAGSYIDTLGGGRPAAKALLRGSAEYPDIIGEARLYQTKDGVLLCVEVIGLPHAEDTCSAGVFGFHIHEGTACTGNERDPFADTGGHYNPGGCGHPHHAGDLPPLLEADGRAFMTVLTDRFKVRDVIGRTMIIHANPDDFTSQPSGNSGPKIACGKIKS